MFINEEGNKVLTEVRYETKENGRKLVTSFIVSEEGNILPKLKGYSRHYINETVELDNSNIALYTKRYFKQVAKNMGGFGILILAINDIEQYGQHIPKHSYRYIKFMNKFENFMSKFNISVC